MNPPGGLAGRAPRASILVPSFDHGPFVLGAVRSALDQTEPDVEVIVLDDGSTDDSMERLATIDDPRVTVLRHPNRGLSRTLNRGLALARSRWVKFLPSDDMLAPACIERQLAAVDADDVGVVFCLPEVVDAYGHPLGDPGPQAWFDTEARDDRSILPGLVERNFLCAPGALFDRDLARELGGFDPDMKVAQDYDLWLRLLVRRRARLLPERLVRVRWHGANQSAVATPSTEAERARALVRAVAPASRRDWVRRFSGDLRGRRGEVVGRRGFAGALLRSGVPDVRPLALELEREAGRLARGGAGALVAGAIGSGLRSAATFLRRRWRPRWMRGGTAVSTSLARPEEASGGAAPARAVASPGAVAEPDDFAPRWIVLDPAPVPAGSGSRAARLADALAARLGASRVALARGGPGMSGDGVVPPVGGARRRAWSLASLRAELDDSPGRTCILVGAPHPEAIAFAREARGAGARVVYDRARAWEAEAGLPWRDREGERALVALADDLAAAGRPLAGTLAAAGRMVHLLVAPDDGGGDAGWSSLVDALLQATRRPTVALIGCAEPGEEMLELDALTAAVAGSAEQALRPTLVAAAGHATPGDVDEAAERARVAFLRCPVAGAWAARMLGLRASGSEIVAFAPAANLAPRGPGAGGLLAAVEALAADPLAGAVVVPADSGEGRRIGPAPSAGAIEEAPGDVDLDAGRATLVCSRRALSRAGLPETGPADRAGADRALLGALRSAGFRVLRSAP